VRQIVVPERRLEAGSLGRRVDPYTAHHLIDTQLRLQAERRVQLRDRHQSTKQHETQLPVAGWQRADLSTWRLPVDS
jgi:hypothetical protein